MIIIKYKMKKLIVILKKKIIDFEYDDNIDDALYSNV